MKGRPAKWVAVQGIRSPLGLVAMRDSAGPTPCHSCVGLIIYMHLTIFAVTECVVDRQRFFGNSRVSCMSVQIHVYSVIVSTPAKTGIGFHVNVMITGR